MNKINRRDQINHIGAVPSNAMKKFFFLLFLIIIISPGTASSGDTISVEAAALARGVENLIPLGVAKSFPAEVGRVYCYSKIVNGDGTTIKHRWYYKGRLVQEVPLVIRSQSFRTYSYKTIIPDFKGIWKVEIVSEEGTVLKALEFTIE